MNVIIFISCLSVFLIILLGFVEKREIEPYYPSGFDKVFIDVVNGKRESVLSPDKRLHRVAKKRAGEIKDMFLRNEPITHDGFKPFRLKHVDGDFLDMDEITSFGKRSLSAWDLYSEYTFSEKHYRTISNKKWNAVGSCTLSVIKNGYLRTINVTILGQL